MLAEALPSGTKLRMIDFFPICTSIGRTDGEVCLITSRVLGDSKNKQ